MLDGQTERECKDDILKGLSAQSLKILEMFCPESKDECAHSCESEQGHDFVIIFGCLLLCYVVSLTGFKEQCVREVWGIHWVGQGFCRGVHVRCLAVKIVHIQEQASCVRAFCDISLCRCYETVGLLFTSCVFKVLFAGMFLIFGTPFMQVQAVIAPSSYIIPPSKVHIFVIADDQEAANKIRSWVPKTRAAERRGAMVTHRGSVGTTVTVDTSSGYVMFVQDFAT